MQVGKKMVAATTAMVIGLGAALAVTAVELRDVRAEREDLAGMRREICHIRLFSLAELIKPHQPKDRENRALDEDRLVDINVTNLCLGMYGAVESSNAELCWALHRDDPRSGHCFDAVFDGLYFLYRFRFGRGY